MKDPGSFTLPVEFEGQEEFKALTDLGASVNLMPLSMFERLKIGELKSTMMNLQLADRSIIFPWGVVEDVLVKVGKLEFPADFVIVDMDEDKKIPLIMGRPFLATAKAKIDVAKGLVSLKANGKRKDFKMGDIKVEPKEQGDAFLLDMMSVWSDEGLENFFRKEGISIEKKPHVLEPTKNGLPSLKSIFTKKKVASNPPLHNRVISFAGVRNNFVDGGAGVDNEILHGLSHQGYNPG
jgi:hypothetical protein